jgi:hypothetical protein
VVANIPGVVYRCACDAEWTIRFMSEHIEKLVGYPASDFTENGVPSYGSINIRGFVVLTGIMHLRRRTARA